MDFTTIFNSIASSFIVIVLTFIFRILIFRPRLKIITLSNNKDPDKFDSKMEEVFRYHFSFKVNNFWTQKVNNPKAYCMGAFRVDDILRNISTPFEMQWLLSGHRDSSFQIFPGVFEYELELGYIDVIRNKKTNMISFSNLYFQMKSQEKTTYEICEHEVHDLCITIGNDNFMIPTYFLRGKISWRAVNGYPIIKFVKKHEGDYWRFRFLPSMKELKLF